MAGIRRGLLAAALVVVLPAVAPAQPSGLVIGTASVGGTYYVYGGALATLLNDKAGLQASTQQTQGPNQNVVLLADGKIGLGMTTMGVGKQALEGSASWTKGRKFAIRALFPMYDTPMQCVSLAKSGIASFRQLDGKTVGAGPKAGTAGTYFPAIFETLGMKVTVRNGQSEDMGNQLVDGLLDAFCFGAGAPIPTFARLDSEQQVVFYAPASEEIAAIRKAFSEFGQSSVPKGTYRQQPAAQATIGLYNFAIATPDMPDDMAYRITKTVLENNAVLVRGHAAARETVAANAARNTLIPFHPGAARYYREKGITLDPATLPK